MLKTNSRREVKQANGGGAKEKERYKAARAHLKICGFGARLINTLL